MSKAPKDGGPAFPVHGGHHPDDDPRNQIIGGGMTLRDWFAGQALSWAGHYNWTSSTPKHLAERAYQMADAMLEARK